jgi:hypothetical protein
MVQNDDLQSAFAGFDLVGKCSETFQTAVMSSSRQTGSSSSASPAARRGK